MNFITESLLVAGWFNPPEPETQGRYGPLTELACPSVAPSWRTRCCLAAAVSRNTNTNRYKATDRQTDRHDLLWGTTVHIPVTPGPTPPVLRWPRLGFVEANAVAPLTERRRLDTEPLTSRQNKTQPETKHRRHYATFLHQGAKAKRVCACFSEGSLTGRVLLRLLCFDSSVSCSSDLKTPRARQPIRLKLSPLATPFRRTTRPHVRSIWSVEGATGAEWLH